MPVCPVLDLFLTQDVTAIIVTKSIERNNVSCKNSKHNYLSHSSLTRPNYM